MKGEVEHRGRWVALVPAGPTVLGPSVQGPAVHSCMSTANQAWSAPI